ncbi:MAG: putative helicase-like protein [Sphingomonas bacterium]|uniref:DUF3320 domain-containing protein n=1 Tax=Sphingomonas bacterium TaxID=1895847 RepID=UPI0026104FC0|nr:DUF3320 domain-containing protein [Sphingomonas bacterium]MDB5696622.1 putative helicase-like protein [Sphingomonas bacterium]
MTDTSHAPPPAAEPPRAAIQRLFDDTRKRLVETGTRNRLVHVNRANTRGNVVNIVNERSDEVYRLLCGGKTMRFHALGQDRRAAGEVMLAAEDDVTIGEDRYTDNRLETRLGPDALAKKLLAIAREAKTAEEEQGVNILYLALGFATWFEDAVSEVAREAPLVLLPVELKRNERTSTYDIRLRDEDAITNLPLQQRWLDDFGLRLPELDATVEGWRPGVYFDAVEAIVAGRLRWRVDRDAIQLGFFSFSKLLMFRDLALDAWPAAELEAHGLTRGLLYERFGEDAPLFGSGDRLDVVLPPDKLHHVVDADASQAKVIEEARTGRNLVVQGPPGTGKSQTITNIIAAAVREGRTVLFVAEKMAALSVVHDRLVKVGLGDVALELHSRTASKRLVLEELKRTLAAAAAVPAMPDAPDALRGVRDRLNEVADALHAPIGGTGETAYAVLGTQARFIGAGVPPPTLDVAGLMAMTRADEAGAVLLLADYAALVTQAGAPERHPFAGVGALDIQPVALARLAGELARAKTAAELLRAALDAPMTAAGRVEVRAIERVVPVGELLGRLDGLAAGDVSLARRLVECSDPARLAAALAAARSWRDLRDAAEPAFVEAAFAGDAADLRGPLAVGAASWWARWGGAYRGASQRLAGWLRDPLPRPAAERLALVDQLGEVAARRRGWADDEAFLAGALGEAWRGELTDFARAAAVAGWCDHARGSSLAVKGERLVAMAADPAELARFRADLAAAAPGIATIDAVVAQLRLASSRLGGEAAVVDLAAIADVADAMANGVDRYGEWVALCGARSRLEAVGLATLAVRVATGAMTAQAAADELRFARAELLWEQAARATPLLASLASVDRHALAAQFGTLERRRLKDNVRTILAGHLAQLPRGSQGEMGVLRSEFGKRTRHKALRRLFREAPQAIQRIKPVLLMSPISVAQYLTPGLLSFDLLVIDEASQVRPEDALGAIARARQIVVVGDQKQLPPSSFFDRLLADGDSEDAEEDSAGGDLLGGAAALGEMESILTLCEARGLPSRMLQWHYRSRDPSLMRVSNAEFYKDELVLPPSPLEKDPTYGLVFTKVAGAYDKGGRRDNRLEGEAVVARVAQHARATPDLSLGIVTFSHSQKNTIAELLELARRTDPVLDALLREGRAEDVFVKNIENVQGDERDVILISVGYGPTQPGGRMAGASFGPVNGDGGERRLNVLFTRARLRCEVFASFDPADLDVSRATRDGPRVLKRFLDYAKTGQVAQPAATGGAADSAFEEDVAAVIASLGYLADPQVGSAGFRIDIGVRHPDRPGAYLLAVECDGAAYHGALWARERDRLRQDVLEHLGWRFHRIWSTDWFANRRAEVDRLRTALTAARAAAETPVPPTGANDRDLAPVVAVAPPPAPELAEPGARTMPAYVRAHPAARYGEPHEAPLAVLVPLVREIVAAEGPIALDEIARRVATAFNRRGAGSRIVVATRAALMAAASLDSNLLCDELFWFTASQQANPPVRDRSGESGATARADTLSILEIRAALAIAREDNPGGSDDELVRNAARLLGFRRVGPEVAARIGAGLI